MFADRAHSSVEECAHGMREAAGSNPAESIFERFEGVRRDVESIEISCEGKKTRSCPYLC